MSKSLPAKFMLETLLKLPVKTLTRFKCVSKQWYSVISNLTFVALHSKLSELTNNGYLLQYKEGNYRESNFSLHDMNLVQFDEVNFPINSTQIVGSCNGLVCLLLNTFHSCHFPMFVWNPSTRKYKIIPCHKSFDWEKDQYGSSANFVKGSFATFAITGFGYDHNANDFKVLLLVHAREVASEQFCREFNEIQVYSLKHNCWRRIQPSNSPCIPCLSSYSSVYLNGAVYWMATRKETGGTDTDIIMSFDFGNEVFRFMKLPGHCTINIDRREAAIGVLEKSIALFVSSRSEDYYAGLGVCNVYVLKENTGVEQWINLFTIDLRSQFAWQYLGFGANGEVMLRNDDGDLVLYDHKTQEIVHCGSSNWVANAVTYTQGLVSP